MNHGNLTARYRPQKFSELAGQETVRAILSRAAAENSVAPAYLFSGTRGVGKTTVARIFAKALNCVHAPAAEPCNECENCRQITMGTAVDVVEIDGASNRGIDDVRKLKEVVGYAPMQGRYKIFIIDEAHMLSRDAFNALLKTLEEPPANVTFIMATTEAHKFPATIISRCQHYVFKRLPENGLEEHLSNVLTRENVPFEEGAVRLLARRAAGSVRDAMSLLGQVLALGGETLTERDTRTVLGLAGQELFFTLFRALRSGDTMELTKMVAAMLDSGLDLGFFLREMALCWRNMFILRQSGDAALSLLDIPAREADRWKEEAASFELAHIHAAWQMTIDGQRRVLTSLEPALALELLLCNIAMLPRLLPLEGVARL
ncbi:MAG: DNA polymerase III subunit gamma/tau, partial [Deltaproteobacteria bacterium]|nr:DNA polymerase III subunit gamma/tau [Deltaproteobacteria bacterium]